MPGDKQDGAHESVDGGDTADDDRSAERPVATSRHTQLPRIDGEGSADVGIVRRESVEHVLIRPSGGGHAGGGSSDVSDRASVGTTNSVHTMFGFDAEDGPPVDSRSGGASAGSIGSAGGATWRGVVGSALGGHIATRVATKLTAQLTSRLTPWLGEPFAKLRPHLC